MKLPVLLLACLIGTFSYGKTLNEYLAANERDIARKAFTAALEADPSDAEARFSLAVIEFVDGIEALMQGLYVFGLDSTTGRRVNLPFLRLPVPANPSPEPATPAKIGALLTAFQSDLRSSLAALGEDPVGDFKVPITIGAIALDIDADGAFEGEPTLLEVFATFNRRLQSRDENAGPLTIHFDRADAVWLEGYCHLLLALTDALLAHDGTPVFEQCAHVFFPAVDTPLAKTLNIDSNQSGMFADLIAGVHVMRLDCVEPMRMRDARAHLLQMIDCSREMWVQVDLETDNDREWIPNPKQTGVTGAEITPEMIRSWTDFLDEFELILEGKLLVPHWRFPSEQGVNMKQVFEAPGTFDPILWVQGAAALPYLEQGATSSPDTWREIMSTFRGQFFGFAIWVN